MVDGFLEQWRRERPDLDPAPMGVIGRVSRLGALFDRELKQFFAGHGLERWEFDVLATLRRAGAPHELTMGALLEHMMVTSGAITNRIDRMAARGLVERRADPADRRSVRVGLTDEGLRLVNAVIADHLDNERRILRSLSAGEQAELAVLLRSLLIGLGDSPQ
ncbi:MarR family transcriptional regulator [Longispora sp. K20-0274]|uniref:MarR family winged helix-turn-helix transcriptional regulator n=1 Tax=Longispora sp. K20-0274 TaxID=3088255 RepID=UPI00399B5E64